MTENPPKETEDRAVSPVIGVILMVAITVILAAVIAAFVLGIGIDDEPPRAALDVSAVYDAGTGEVTYTVEVTSAGTIHDLRFAGCATEEDIAGVTAGEVGTGAVYEGTDDIGCSDGETLSVVAIGADGGEAIVGQTEVRD